MERTGTKNERRHTIVYIRTENVPQFLKDNGRFCSWKYEQRGGRQTKVPYIPGTTRRACVDDLSTFTDFEAAAAAARYDGIGICVCDRIVHRPRPLHRGRQAAPLGKGNRGQILRYLHRNQPIRERDTHLLPVAGRLRL